MKKLLVILALLVAPPAFAQNVTVKVVSSCGAETLPTTSNALRMDVTGKLCTAASVSASITGFAPGATGTPISVTTSSTTGTLPAGAVVVATNVGATNGAYCALGATATTASQYLSPGGGWFAFTIGGSTQLSCITSTSTTTVNMTGGSGLPTGTGGGGGGSGGGGGAITAASGSYASGAMSAGSYAAGALAAGAFATGAGVDGWDVTKGAKADAVCGTATGTCSVIALLKFLNTAAGLPLPAQSTRTVNIGAADLLFDRMASAAISVSTATTTQVVALSGTTKIYVTSYDVIAGGTGNITFVYGTGSSCGAGTTSLTGAYNLTAQAGIAKGAGVAPILVVPAGNALCVTTSAAVQMSGSVSYQQF